MNEIGTKITIGPRLRHLRQARGMTQHQLALKAGTTADLISKYETQRHQPTLAQAVKLAAALEVSLGDLLPDDQHWPVQPL